MRKMIFKERANHFEALLCLVFRIRKFYLFFNFGFYFNLKFKQTYYFVRHLMPFKVRFVVIQIGIPNSSRCF